MPTYASLEDVAWGPLRDIEVLENFSDGQTSVDFKDTKTHEIFEIRKNDSQVDDTSYSFSRPRTIDFDSQLSSDDVLEVDRLIYLRREQVEHQIENAEDFLNSRLKNTYDVPFESGDVPDRIRQLTETLAQGYVIQELSTMDDYRASEAELNLASEKIQNAKSEVEDLRLGDEELPELEADKDDTSPLHTIYLDDSREDDVV